MEDNFPMAGVRGWLRDDSSAYIYCASYFYLFIYTSVMYFIYRASLKAQLVKNLPAMQETPVQFLGWEDPPEKG